MAEGETVFTFKANTKPAEQAVEDFGDKVIGISKKIGASFAAYLSIRALAGAFEKATEAGMEAEQAVLQFNSALSLAGTYSAQATASFQAFASSLERTTGVSDELILTNSALLVSIGKLSGEGLERATKAALDLSRGLQVDVSTAFDIVTKATQGNVMALTRYGLEVGKADSDSTKFAKTLEFIEARFGGLSTGSINTYSGAVAKLRNGFEDMFESIGRLIVTNPKVIATLSVFGDVFYKISENIASSNVNVGKFIDYLFQIGQFITTFVITPLEGLVRWMMTTTLALPRLMLTIYTEIAGLADKMLGTDLRSKIDPIKQMIVDIQTAAATPLFTEEEMFATKMSRAIDTTKIKIDELSTKLRVELPAAAAQGSTATLSSWEKLKAGFGQGLKTMSEDVTSLGKTVASTFVQGMTNAFASVGKAIVQGQNAFGAFGNAILMMLGNVAMQMGSFYIAAGAAAMWLNPASGWGMIAAGAALATLGGVLQALGTGGGTPAAGAAGGANAPGSSPMNPLYTSPMSEQTPEAERMAPQTGVQVVVQGNVFDSRETGLRIAEIINDSFDLNGTIVRATV